MKKPVLIGVASTFALLLMACGGNSEPQPSSSSSVSESSEPSSSSVVSSSESSSESSSSKEAIKLDAPTIEIVLIDGVPTVTLTGVANATSYEYGYVGEGEPTTTDDLSSVAVALSDDIDLVAGQSNHAFYVMAKGDGVDYADSDRATYEYTVKVTKILSFTADANGHVEWNAQGKTISFAAYDAEYAATTPTGTYDATETGMVHLKAESGFDEENRIYYVGGKAEKHAPIAFPATSAVVLIDGNEASDSDLQEKWTNTKFSGNAWEPAASSSVNLSDENEGFTSGKCVAFKYSQQGYYFSFDRPLEIDGGFNNISFYAKGNDASTLGITLTVDNPDSPFAGVYVSYLIPKASSSWTYYSIPLDAEGWSYCGNGAVTLAQAARAGGMSILQASSLFDTIHVRAMERNDAYSTVYAYMDDLKVSYVENQTSEVEKTSSYKVYPTYSIVSDSMKGIAALSHTEGTITFTDTAHASLGTQEVTVATEGNRITLTSKAGLFTYVGEMSESGAKVTFVEATGEAAAMLEGVGLSSFVMLDNFESYTETGTGFDKNHTDPTAVTGLRAAYYSDYWSTDATSSVVGGKNWSLMGSTDYLQLNTAGGHTGNQSAKVKASTAGAMRMISSAICYGQAPRMGRAKTFSFWAKGVDIDVKINARIFYINSVGPSTVANDSYSTAKSGILIPANSDWAEYTVTIIPGRTVYGFSLTCQGTSKAVYPLVDDIMIYSASPWGE